MADEEEELTLVEVVETIIDDALTEAEAPVEIVSVEEDDDEGLVVRLGPTGDDDEE